MNIKCIYLRDKLKKYIKNSISNRKYPIRPSESDGRIIGGGVLTTQVRPTSNWSMRILADVFFLDIQQLIEFFIYFFNLSLKYIHFIFICLTTKTPYGMGDIQCPPYNWNGGYSMPSIQQEWGIFNALHPTRMGDTQCPPIY